MQSIVNMQSRPTSLLRHFTLLITLTVLLMTTSFARAAETVPPLTTPSPIMGTYGTTQNVTLTCSDGTGSGCASTWYCLGSGCTPSTPYSGPVSVASTTNLSFYSTDLDGNSEQVRTYAYTIDPTLAYRFERLWPQLQQPWYFKGVSGVVADSSGNVYVAETGNNRIQKFDANGAFVTSWGKYGGIDGQFNYPYGLAVDLGGYVYVADTSNHRIQKFTSNGTFVDAWGSFGSGTGQFNGPTGIAVDSDNNIYVADRYNHRVQKFTANGTFVVSWGTAGSSTGQFASPAGIAADSFGNIYVADTNNSRIQKFDSNGTFLATWGSNGSTNGKFIYPRSITADAAGNIYIADSANNRIQKLDSNGAFVTAWGSYGSGNGQLNDPYGISADPYGNIYVADTNNWRIQKFDSTGAFLTLWTPYGSSNGMFNHPRHCAVDAGGIVYVADYSNNRVQKFTGNGSFLGSLGTYGSGNGQFKGTSGIAVDSAGNLYVADLGNNRIQKFSSGGIFVTAWGTYGTGNGQFSNGSLKGLAVDASGNVYAADSANHRIQKFDANGTFLTKWGSNGSGAGQFSSPSSIAIDANGYVYVADTDNSRIQKFDPSGNFILSWGSTQSSDIGKFRIPVGIALDQNGNVYVADTENHRIQKFDGSGTVLSVWGTAQNASGSGSGLFSSPEGICLDSIGNAYAVDTGNHRMQKFTLPNLPGAPEVPTGVTATPGYGQASVTFSPPYSDGGSAITSYTVMSSPGNITATGSASPITITGLANYTTYTFSVTATNSGGTGPASAPSNSIIPFSIYPLSVTVNGSGTVHSSPAPDINCSGSCGQSYSEGNVVTFTAVPGSGYTFSGWSGACSGTGECSVFMYDAQTVSAMFTATVGNGVCGAAHNSESVDKPTTSLCANGTPSAVNGIGPWTWTCSGGSGGLTASCSAIQAGGVFYRSFDGGATWTGRVTGIGFNSPITALVPSPCFNSSDLTLFIGAGDGTYKSLDGGDSWTRALNGYSAQAVALSPYYCSDNTLFAGFMLDGIQRSTDGGATWNSANSGLPSTQIRSLAVSTGIPGDQTVFAGILGNGIYKSTNNGSTWSSANSGISTLTPLSLAISPNYSQDHTLFAATTDGQYSGGGPHYHIYRSSDGGGSWTLADSGLAGAITKLELSEQYATDHTLFAVTGSGIYRSTDSGITWTRVNMATTGNSLALSKDYMYDHILFAGIYGDNVYKSADSGTTWTPSTSDFATVRQLSAVAISPVYYFDKIVFATAYFAGPQLSVSPGSLSFGNVAAGTSSTSRQVTIANGMFGDANLAINAITLSGTGASQYTIAPGSCGTLTPILTKGGQCAINVTFNPTASGSASATLQITSNAVMSPTANVTLSGTGITVSSTVSTPVINGNNVSLSGTASCSAGDSVAGVEISFNNGATWQPASGTTSWSISLTLPDGSYPILSRATTSSGIVETPVFGGVVNTPGIIDTDAPTGNLALYNGVWTLNASDGQACVMVYPLICGTMEMSPNGVSGWQPATTAPGTAGPLWLRDRAGNVSARIDGAYSNVNGGPIRLEGGSSTYYSFVQHALNAAGSGALLKINAALYSENLTVNTFSTGFTIRGGYNSGHSSVTGTTQLGGSLTVQAGTLTVENLDVAGTVTLNGGTVTASALSIQ